MMRLNVFMPIVMMLACSGLMSSCGGGEDLGTLLDMGITGNGLILRTVSQSCTDVDSASLASGVVRSLAAPSMHFSGFSLTWKSSDLNLYIGTIQLTVKSPYITNGQQIFQLDGGEIEAMLGAIGDVVPHKVHATDPDVILSSTNTGKDKSSTGVTYSACGIGVGGITLINPNLNQQFTADVEVELIGAATSDDGSNQQTVLKTIDTSATYY